MTEPVLSVRGITFGYGERKLFQNLSFSLHRGELVAIVGKSGLGKSTLFELIARNLEPQKGKITAKNIGWIFQDPYSSFHPSYSVLMQVLEVAKDKNYKQYLKQLSLTKENLNALPHQLSGGQLQRCSILRALLMRPDILLCDEPTSALDNIVQLETMKLLVSLLDDFGILLITHDEALANWAADRIIELERYR